MITCAAVVFQWVFDGAECHFQGRRTAAGLAWTFVELDIMRMMLLGSYYCLKFYTRLCVLSSRR